MSDNLAQVLTVVAALAFWGWTQWLDHRKESRARCCRRACTVCSGHPVCTTDDDAGPGDECGGAG
ncbi:hypothetical protein VSR01_17170 [Actinacidiphila sp. DG2A-62]|uniref:hypothetical protein n=1 Tax=Actinacidiphila sp. DG2A-62 TaxID=3108821 RepID=UPI002DBCDC22|nr:hypothetical protein [Actinacidiphila sp. DG2A-62]MEC3995170.1 hypothetical protein [Actinacidiphila sp. DG2A-62]